MSNTSFGELDFYPDPSTPEYLLPRHLRRDDNGREELCRRVALRVAMTRLSEKQREALHMRYNLGLSFRKLSAELGISRSAVEKRLKRSQESLKAMIELCVLVQKEMGNKGSG
ncbi:MAG: sigma-70 family RNA polymerase sigma factor [Oscillospiraceae bacterium]|nr:sigma-70 family RNA polymerase sigma factor [Oscillospiraceae bacterium]